MTKLPAIEWTVLHGIPRGAASPITTSDLCKLTRLDVREVRQSVNNLVNRYGVPVVASRSANRGLYIATTEAERTAGLAAFTSQVSTMAIRIQAIKDADLEHWEDGLKPDIRPVDGNVNTKDAG